MFNPADKIFVKYNFHGISVNYNEAQEISDLFEPYRNKDGDLEFDDDIECITDSLSEEEQYYIDNPLEDPNITEYEKLEYLLHNCG